MRQILIEQARRKASHKHGGQGRRIERYVRRGERWVLSGVAEVSGLFGLEGAVFLFRRNIHSHGPTAASPASPAPGRARSSLPSTPFLAATFSNALPPIHACIRRQRPKGIRLLATIAAALAGTGIPSASAAPVASKAAIRSRTGGPECSLPVSVWPPIKPPPPKERAPAQSRPLCTANSRHMANATEFWWASGKPLFTIPTRRFPDGSPFARWAAINARALVAR